MLFGTHVSIKGGLQNAPIYAEKMGQTTFQFYTRNARSWKAKPLENDSIELFKERRKSLGFKKVVVHMPYLPNLSNIEDESQRKTRDTLLSEVIRCDKLGVDYLVLHLGSHKGKGSKLAIESIVNHLNAIPKSNVTLLLENTAGTKNAVGSDFSEISVILDELGNPKNIGVCLDTCHTHAAGYNLSSNYALETLDRIHEEINLSNVKVIHVNDAKGEVGSKRDRHWHIGLGTIGLDGFKEFFSHDLIRTREFPLILETPITPDRDDLGNLQALKNILKSTGVQ